MVLVTQGTPMPSGWTLAGSTLAVLQQPGGGVNVVRLDLYRKN